MSHQPTGTEALVAAFSFNKNLHQAKLDWRFNEQFTDPRWATAYVGAELLAHQERAAKRYDQQATALRGSIDEQTRQNAENARVLHTTIKESSEAVRREMSNVAGAVRQTTEAVNDLTSQIAQMAWLQAEQNATLRQVLETIRERRANECRQLVEQGEKNLRAGFLNDAEERFRLALKYDNTDYPTHQNLGLTLVALGRLDEALEHFTKALAFPPKGNARSTAFFVSRAATHAARVLYAKGNYAGAEAFLVKALDGDDSNAKNWYDLGVVRTYEGDKSGALDALAHALRGNAQLAGAALSDTELETIRPAIETLVVDQTERAMRTNVEEPADALRRTNRRIAEMARDVGVEVQPVNIDEIVRTAKQRGTLPATLEAFRALSDERTALVMRTRAAMQRARAATDQEQKERVAALDAERSKYRAETNPVIFELRSASSRRGNAAVQLGISFLGFIAGAVIGGNMSGCGGVVYGGGIGAILGLVIYAMFYYSGKAGAKAELEKAVATEEGVYAEIQADEAAIKSESAARLKKIEVCLAELEKLSS
jgi:tetratricopeptide (TPR) repeat protein